MPHMLSVCVFVTCARVRARCYFFQISSAGFSRVSRKTGVRVFRRGAAGVPRGFRASGCDGVSAVWRTFCRVAPGIRVVRAAVRARAIFIRICIVNLRGTAAHPRVPRRAAWRRLCRGTRCGYAFSFWLRVLACRARGLSSRRAASRVFVFVRGRLSGLRVTSRRVLCRVRP